MNKKKWIKAGLLSLVFVIALVGFSLITNRGTEDLTVDLGEPSLPRIAFTVEGSTINYLEGYVQDMEIPSMRDTITPANEDGTVHLLIDGETTDIGTLRYEVWSLDGEERLVESGTQFNEEGAATVNIGTGILESSPEVVLKVILQAEDQNISYYTRVKQPADLSVQACLGFAQRLHQQTFDSKASDEWGSYLEPNEQSDNTTLQTVNIHSNVSHIQWGDLEAVESTPVEWSLKESNTVYSSILATYQVTCEGDNEETETYNVKEFFRVRSSEGEMYLLDYHRTMNQVFNGTHQVLDEDGIVLGIGDFNVSYRSDEKENLVAFVQERDLWLYNRSLDELSQIFSFANKEGHDVRSRYDQHSIKILSLDTLGNMAFTVTGYMNQGMHEGEVGVAVYYYSTTQNAVEEKAFIPSTRAFGMTQDELGKMVYYNDADELLYVLAGGQLYEIDMRRNRQEVLAESLSEGQYVASEDGHLLAYQTDGDLQNATTVEVLNLATEESFEIEAPQGEAIRPVGFMEDDFICGYMRSEDAGKTAAGEDIYPMYALEIHSMENEVLKTYTSENAFVSRITTENGLVTVKRLQKDGDAYREIADDYITSTVEVEEQGIELETFETELKEAQLRLTFQKQLENLNPRILRTNQVMLEEPLQVSFEEQTAADKYYVYGYGDLAGIYEKPADAIARAETVSGVVVASNQSYVWERGNRDLVYYTETGAFQKQDDQNSIEACEAYMEQFGAKRADLTGCTLEQVLYVVNQGLPVIVRTDSSHAVLLTGYSMTDAVYVNPDTGEEVTVSLDEMNGIAAGGGNVFIGYLQ